MGEELFEGLPGIDWEGVQRTLRERVFPAYLEYRTGFGEFDCFLGKSKPFWELRCSGCGEAFAMEKAKDLHVSRLEFCPSCGKPVKAIRWRYRPKRVSQVMVKILLRGADRKVWMRCWRIELMIGGDGAALSGYEKARFLFEDGAAHKWKTKWDREADDYRWEKNRRITHENWNTSLYGYAMYAPEVYLDGCTIMEENEEPDYSGTCIEYSAFGRLLSYRSDLDIVTGPIEEYLALYCKHPIVEYLVKGGFERWIEEYLQGHDRTAFQKVVNLRAKKPKALLKKLTMAEAKLLKNYKMSVAYEYQRLKEEGAIREAEVKAVWYAKAAGDNRKRYEYILRGSGGDGKKLRSYLERQAKKRKRERIGRRGRLPGLSAGKSGRAGDCAGRIRRVPARSAGGARAPDLAAQAQSEKRASAGIPDAAAQAAAGALGARRAVYPPGGQSAGNGARGRTTGTLCGQVPERACGGKELYPAAARPGSAESAALYGGVEREGKPSNPVQRTGKPTTATGDRGAEEPIFGGVGRAKRAPAHGRKIKRRHLRRAIWESS